MRQTFTIPGRLAGLNDYIRAAHSPWQRTQLKQEQEAIVMAAASHLRPMQPPVEVGITYYEGKTRPREQVRDLDNVAGGGNKFILDALVSMGVIPDDDTENVPTLTVRGFRANPDMGGPRIVVELVDGEG